MTPETSDRVVRRLARSVEAIHTLTYYSPEISRLTDHGFRGWWHAYFAYRSAPLGPVEAPVVIAAFYNFAPRMVERAVPGVWDVMAPAEVLRLRQELVAEVVERIWSDGRLDTTLAEAADLAEAAVANLEPEARPLAAAHATLERPDRSPGLALWRACTIWREYRGDSHNLALAGAEIDGVEAHLLMAAHGRGNQPTITGIRGWTPDEWAEAQQRLVDRGILETGGGYTAAGRQFRSEIEVSTDRLSNRPLVTLGVERSARLADLLDDVMADLLENEAVPGIWPPPTVLKNT